VNVSWGGIGNAENYEYAVTTSATPPVSGTETDSTSLSVSDLEEETTYYLHVRANCGSGDYSSWATISFYTGYCQVEGTSSSYRINGVSTDGGWTNISNMNNGTANSYSNYSTMSVSQSPGGTIDYTVNVPGYTGIKIWIDLNQDLIFDDTELVASHTTYMYSAGDWTGTITLPTDIPEGDYRIRIRSGYYSYPDQIYVCGINYSNYGEAEDYTLTVVPLPSCLPPSDLTAENITSDSADLSWTANGDLFDIEIVETGEEPTSIPTETGVSNPYIAEGLNPSTAYDYYVRQDCGDDDGVSMWAGPFSFTTTQIPAELNFEEDFESTISWTLNNGGQTNQWVVGSATGNTGNSLYISNDEGITNAYSTGSTSVVQAYRDIAVPAETFKGAISFDWKVAGEPSSWSDPYDYFKVWLVPAAYLPTAGAQISSGTGRIQLGGYFVNETDWQQYENSELDLSEFAGSTMRLVFEWTNDSGSGTQPPAAIDNIEITIPACPQPMSLGITNITKESADLNWASVGDIFDIKWEEAGFDVETEGTLAEGFDNGGTLSELEASTNYEFYVRQDCNEEGTSEWSGPYAFTTLCDYPDYELINSEDDLTLCETGSITLEADSEGTVNWYDAADATEPIFTGTTFETEELTETTSFWVESVSVAEGEGIQVGTGTSTADNFGSPFYHNWGGHKYQYIFTTEELSEAGMYAGNISGLAFDVIQEATVSFNDFTIAIGATEQSVATTTHIGGLTQVYSNSALATPVGIHYYEFDEPFDWDGESNIVVQINWSNNNSGSFTTSNYARVRTHTTTENQTTNTRADNRTAAQILATMTGAVVNASGITSGDTYALNRRPNTYFMGMAACKSPREEVVVTVIPSFEITDVTVDDITGDSATLQIESEGTVFEIEYGEAGFTPGDATGTNIPEAGSTYVLEDLVAQTSYDVYVRASSCAEWFGPVSFTTIIAVNQTITAEDVTKVYGDAPFINGESDSGLALSYTIEDESVAVFEDGQIVIVGSGATEITASQSGNAMYLPAEDVTFTLTVGKAPLTLSVEDVTKAYDGEVYAAWTIVYDEFVNDDDATDLSGELIYSGDGVTAITPGTYAIEIGGLTSNNYDISFVGGELTITKAELTGITFEDALLIYDGTAKSIAISGELPNDVTVTYTGNGQTEVGDYPVTATIDGGANYEDLELEATMSIRGELTGISFEDAEFVYDGDEKSLAITGTLPTGVTVTYTGNNQTNAGVYEVTANIDGGSDYIDQTLTATLTITKATLTGITLSDGEFVYDGNAESLFITGTLPTGVTVAYTGNNKTEAGVYEVVATINGGDNYEGLELTAELTIVKANLSDVLSLANASFVYDGDAKSLAVSGDIPTGVTVSYTGNGQTEAGVYEVTATINGGNNYESLELTAELTIEKAEIADIVFADGIFGYDGSTKSLAISGTLPAGASVTYTGNGQSELGEYEVVASIDGGTNYNDLELTATLTITEGTIPGITFADGYFVYDGSAKSIYISGELPQGSTVSYSNNGQTEAGTYVVTATISGGELYNDLELSASLTIAKAQIQDLVFADGIFTYDGAEKSLHISGSLPSGVSVSYQNNGKVNAGVYTVVANISGNANYAALRLTAVLTIEKAPQQINFAALAPVSVTASDFQLSATASSGLAVRYSYSYDTDTPAAEVSDMGWVTVNHLGEITITVSQEGNSNYQAAAPVSRVLTVINKDASVRELWIENEYYSAPQHEVYHLIDCTDLRSSVSVRIVAGEGASIAPGKEFTIRVPKPGIYTQSVTVTSQDGSSTEEYVIVVEKPFSFKEIAEQKFNNTLLINNNPKTNGGYRFVAYQWFKDGELVGEEQAYSAGSRSLLDSHSVYHGIVTTEDGQEIHVCPMEIAQGIAQSIQLYPNPVRFGGATTLSVSSPDAVLKGLPVKIYNLKGQLVHTVYMDGDITTFELPQSMQSGMYIAVFELAGQQQSIKFIVE
jgi:hypothetical protein